MIKSMTGFGRGEYSDELRTVSCEIRSVNHRYADVSVKLSRHYSFAEDAIKKIVKQTVKRGKAEVSVIVDNTQDADVEIRFNEAVARQYYENLTKLNDSFELEGEITLGMLAGMPDVLKVVPKSADEDSLTAAITEAVKEAAKNHDAMRLVEGNKLKEDLEQRAETVIKIVEGIEKRSPKMVEEYETHLRERIEELLNGSTAIPEERIATEVAIFSDKSSITEELVRLHSHTEQMHRILSGEGPVGKKLDFLVQEMNREANTIGSKANDLEITKHMLDLKSEVEKIREQVQNLE